MKDLISRTRNAICIGATVADIHDMLILEGLTEYQAWITYMAAKILAKN